MASKIWPENHIRIVIATIPISHMRLPEERAAGGEGALIEGARTGDLA